MEALQIRQVSALTTLTGCSVRHTHRRPCRARGYRGCERGDGPDDLACAHGFTSRIARRSLSRTVSSVSAIATLQQCRSELARSPKAEIPLRQDTGVAFVSSAFPSPPARRPSW
jgi:hypothetical protein